MLSPLSDFSDVSEALSRRSGLCLAGPMGIMQGMTWRLRYLLLHGLIPILLCSLILPSGIMPGRAGGSPALVLCQATAGTAHDTRHNPSGRTSRMLDVVCPFAASASAAPIPTTTVVAPRVAHASVERGADRTQQWSAFGPYRTSSPRGPPTVSLG